MVSASRNESGVQVLSAGVKKTIQSIKEIVGNHSDAEIYVALKDSNMDPNETAQKLLNQDPFHEVKRKRDRKKENTAYKGIVAVEPRKSTEPRNSTVPRSNTEPPRIPLQTRQNTYYGHNTRRGGFNRNLPSDEGAGPKFRVVRDNRVTQNAGADSKSAQSSTTNNDRSVKNNVTGKSGHQKPPASQHSSQTLNDPADPQREQTKDATSGGIDKNVLLGEKSIPGPTIAASKVQQKTNDLPPQSTNSSNSSVVGVYSSASDPVHVPSLHSRPAANVGAIRRDVGVVGPRRQSSENSAKSSQSTPLPNSQSSRESNSRESARQISASKGEQPSQNVTLASSSHPSMPASRSFSSNHHGSRAHQSTGHQKAPQPNKEWKPKSSLKPSATSPGIIGTSAKSVSPPAENLENSQKESVQLQESGVSQLNISENQNVIIASHIRVSETDRCRLTFGTLGNEVSSSVNPVFSTNEGAEELSTKPSGSASVSIPESSGDENVGSKQVEIADDTVRSSESHSPASADQQLTEKDSLGSRNLENYADPGLVRDNGPSYTPETIPQQDVSELRSFSQNYETPMQYDISYFRPMVDETARGSGLISSQEMLGPHSTTAVPGSMAMVQQQQHQQQQQMAQMYPPQLHVSHFAANVMPYRQFISPVYVPQMPVQGYSNNPAYAHPSNGSNYMIMPGNNSHLTPGGLKYGIQPFKPVPAASPTGFGNFAGPTGYAVNTPGVVGSTPGHEDTSRLKYKDSLYVPNPQAETSEIWMNHPRDISGLQSAYYNMQGQTAPHTYLPSHSGHTSFNVAAAAAAQSSHMQFQPGMYHHHHPQTQPAAMANPHHMGPGNIGMGVAGPAPGAQVGAYPQPNWAM